VTDLPRCKLCQCEPKVSLSLMDLSGRYRCDTHKCPISESFLMLTADQWAALMGVDRDAVRYRWLREQHKKHLGLTICTVGMYDLVPWSGDDPDSAIDSAMGEQQ
jgi:hypothetical protein